MLLWGSESSRTHFLSGRRDRDKAVEFICLDHYDHWDLKSRSTMSDCDSASLMS